jgi:hypothetical protein
MKPEEICHDQLLERTPLVRNSLVEPEVSGRMKGLFAMCPICHTLIRIYWETPQWVECHNCGYIFDQTAARLRETDWSTGPRKR